MRRNIISTALILSLTLFSSGCASYQGTDGTHYADPKGCEEFCPLLFIAAFAGIATAAATHH